MNLSLRKKLQRLRQHRTLLNWWDCHSLPAYTLPGKSFSNMVRMAQDQGYRTIYLDLEMESSTILTKLKDK